MIAVGIFLFDKVEVLDFAGPFEVFSTAARVRQRHAPAEPYAFRVCTISQSGGVLRTRAGLQVHSDFAFGAQPALDVLVVPGGVITDQLAKPEVINWIRDMAAGASITASVCTGAFLLAQAGLLASRPATTHWEDLDALRTQFPDVQVRTGVRWVDDGNRVTSAGISAGIDMSLHLVERLAGRELAVQTARQMDFDWNKNA